MRPGTAGRFSFWSKAEDAIVREFYPVEGRKKCLARLPGRSMKSLIHRARFLKVKVQPMVAKALRDGHPNNGKSPPWTVHEDVVIGRFYPRGGARACMPRLPNRTRDAIYLRAVRLGVQVDPAAFGALVTAGRDDLPPPAEVQKAIEHLDDVVQAWVTSRAVPRVNSIAGTIYDPGAAALGDQRRGGV